MEKDLQTLASFLCWEGTAAEETCGDVLNILNTGDEVEKHRVGKNSKVEN